MYGSSKPVARQGRRTGKGRDGNGTPHHAVRLMLTVYPPDEQWPDHAKAYWNDVLAQAKAAGWTLEHLDAPHTFGFVRCPAGQHTFKVDSTARDAETWAKNAAKSIRICRHGTAQQAGSKVHSRIQVATALLDTADQLTDSAESSLDLLERNVNAQAELERLELLVTTAGLSVDQAAQESALAEAIEADQAAPEAAEVEDSLTEVSTHITEATATLKNVRKHPGLTKPLYARIAALRERLKPLADRLAEFAIDE